MKVEPISEWKEIEGRIRYRQVKYVDWDGEECIDYEFEVFKRPYLWGMLGREAWERSVMTNDFVSGLSFSRHLVKKIW